MQNQLFFIKRSKVRKVNHAFLPQGFHIEDLTYNPDLLPCLVSQLALLAELCSIIDQAAQEKKRNFLLMIGKGNHCKT